MKLSFSEYQKKVNGCFLGKAVGGTLGMPYEGVIEELTVTYYDPVPTAMMPNDDLDLQIVNMEHILQNGLPISTRYLADLWRRNLKGWPDEYGVADYNLESGIYPPLSGKYNNFFHGGMGAVIRSELWACLCPGDPELAAKLSLQDSSMDHHDDGVDAEMFLAAVESEAFVENDTEILVECGLNQIPSDGRLARALRATREWWNECHDIHEVRKRILTEFHADNWTDVAINLSFILLAWLAGSDNFSACICIAAGLGYDADCTTASLGSILGILHPDQIEEKWTKPIGDDLVMNCCMVGMHEPKTIDAFCNRIIGIAPQVLCFYGSDVEIQDYPESKYINLPSSWTDFPEMAEWENDGRTAVAALEPLVIHVKYPENIALIPGHSARFTIKFLNPSKQQFSGNVMFTVPDGWKCLPEMQTISLESRKDTEIPLLVTPDANEKRRANYNPLRIVLSFGGFRCTTEVGMPMTYPWLRRHLPDGKWEKIEIPSRFIPVPKGKWEYCSYFKSTCTDNNVNLKVQGYRKTKTEPNGITVAESDGNQYVPAFHREKDVTRITLVGDINSLKITADDGEPAELFFGFAGTTCCCRWKTDLEWIRQEPPKDN